MISSGYVENLVIETVLAWNLTVVDEPLVAVIVNWGIGNCVAMESRLWEREKKLESRLIKKVLTYMSKVDQGVKVLLRLC